MSKGIFGRNPGYRIDKFTLIGKKFGKLTVISFHEGGKNSKWDCICDCGKKCIVTRCNLIQGHTRSCGCIISIPKDSYDVLRERDFFRFIEKTDGCWIWKGGLDKQGYGNFSYGSKNIKAHRYSFDRFKEPIRSGLGICHKCDNRKCVNPDHLYAGTPKQNSQDMIDRKTWGKPRKRLSYKQKNACKILFIHGFSMYEISEVLKISTQTVSRYCGDKNEI